MLNLSLISILIGLVLSNKDESISPVRIADFIMQNLINTTYDYRVRPYVVDLNEERKPVEVTVNVYLRSISNIDFVNMQYSLQITFRESWIDPRLSYEYMKSSEREELPDYIVLSRLSNTEMIWMPDTFFVNEKQAHRHVIDAPNMLIRVHRDGRVLFSERISLVLSCPMYLEKYPMDIQTCLMDFASYAYTTDDLVYHWKTENPIQFHVALKSSLPSFSLENVETASCSSKTNTGEYSCLRTIFKLERQFSYYLLQVYIPSTLLVIVSWVSFWLDRGAVPARVTLGVTTLLSMTTQAGAINQKLPPVSYIKAIDIWTAVCLSFIFGAVLEYAYVSYLGSILQIKKVSKQKGCEKHSSTYPPDITQNALTPESEALIVEKSKRKPIWGLQKIWYEMQYEADSAKMIDIWSRFLFPSAFTIFNVFYWVWYALI
ncbi:unnamed protein product, partial [Mesorhabditis belari]|uniref:Glutamate-gated chloride channel n=1 Tax=Mesorhabditis belari TaxID=2138241 RepID=A0AAF3FFC1_9BILA